mmetsp:Transcript_13794/g.35198  ORF Transcript_13794/g.35198 Transcript_13794/m.35198 type:complete len:102 (+) Transcript_13794:118-423(+)|eukprot:CAMPEP_0177629492 /NCGR_PEP_ID=MMETSP0447-20121125/697_1 /TAXON_ID=0 /ORGANISM="Stygamoeba regulata, Strain BSH-02190019" /LENGTH=101 /DNA_ID=CAMNT_0019130817 /DNA_START=108 /DNA_END=413 /DNA_ORIENTATION=+
MDQTTLEHTVRTLTQKDGVEGVVVCKRSNGDIIRYTLADPALARRYAALAHALTCSLSTQLSVLDPDDATEFVNITTRKHQLILSTDEDYLLLTVATRDEH